MTRIEGIEPRHANLFIRFVYSQVRRTVGKVTGSARLVEPFKIIAHQWRLLIGVGQMELAIDKMATVPLRLKSLASIKAAMLVGCPY